MPERRRGPRPWLLLAFAVVLAGGFAYLNSGERVSLHLGLFVLFRVPLALLLFVVFLLGMGTMFLVGLRHDLRVRRLLREYRIQAERRPWEEETLAAPPFRPIPPPPLPERPTDEDVSPADSDEPWPDPAEERDARPG